MAVKVVSLNRKAYHDYTIVESLEAGLALTGSEIKSVRGGRVDLRDGYAGEEKGELWLQNVHIARYDAASLANHEPRRPRKLLLHRREIDSLVGRMRERGFTLVPLKLYLKNGRAKVELGLAKGKKLYDKREAIARRSAQREMERAVKRR